MRSTGIHPLGLLLLCSLLPAGVVRGENPVREIPLLNVELIDAQGVRHALKGFRMLHGDFRFRGYLGSAEIEVSYDRIRGIDVSVPAQPGGRMRAALLLRSGRRVQATFGEREGEILFAGFTELGRVTFFFRDVRRLKLLGRTRREDLPAFGKGTGAVDVRIRDRQGVGVELSGFRRSPGESTLSVLRGSTSVTIPLRALRSLSLAQDPRLDRLAGVATLKRSGKQMRFSIPVFEENRLYRGDAEFGPLRIRLRDLREVIIHRPTPRLRKLDPLEAARGKAIEEDAPRR